MLKVLMLTLNSFWQCSLFYVPSDGEVSDQRPGTLAENSGEPVKVGVGLHSPARPLGF